MGIKSSKTSILPFHHHRSTSQGDHLASDFYWACRNGDLQSAQNIYPKLTYEQLNQIQPNGSTALHAACSMDHPHVVKFLLENGCCRTVLNGQKQTAYEVAATEAIRRLFDRPWSQRFVQDKGTNVVDILSAENSNSTANKLEEPDDWVTGRTSAYDTREAQFMLALGRSSSIFKKIVMRRLIDKYHTELLNLLNRTIPVDDRQHKKALDLYQKYLNKEGVHHLLTLYTMETGFYRALQGEADAFASVLYLNLSELQSRAFTGRAYRGMAMIENDIDAYRWALNKKESWHKNLLETRTLLSMSIRKEVALGFSKGGVHPSNRSVLFEFEFPEICPTAIKLFKVSDNLPCLSDFGPEAEVLLLPFTLFQVKDIHVDPERGEYRVSLIHVPTRKRSLRKGAGQAGSFFMK